MNILSNTQKLNQAIAVLEKKQNTEFTELKNTTNAFVEAIKPSNLLENVVNKFTSPTSNNIKSNLLTSAISLASGFVTRKFIEKSSNSFVRKAAGYALQFLVTKLVSKVQNT